MYPVSFNTLVGLTLSKIEFDRKEEKIVFTTSEGKVFHFFHQRECCEGAQLEDICGELSDLVGSPILVADESSTDDPNNPNTEDHYYSWTFYKLATAKGWVDIRWSGDSNGCYSEAADLYLVEDDV